MLSDGVITGMNFFTRKVKNTILMFKQKIISKQQQFYSNVNNISNKSINYSQLTV
jgi:hypothetical protein